MSIVLDQNTLFNDFHFENYAGIYSGSQGYVDLAPTYVPTAHTVQIDTTARLTTGFNTYYKIQGYNPNTGTYEVWHCMNTPVLTPPSGDNLLGISIVSSWTDR